MRKVLVLLAFGALAACGTEPPQKRDTAKSQAADELYDDVVVRETPPPRPVSEAERKRQYAQILEEARRAPPTSQSPQPGVESGAETLQRFNDDMREIEQDRRIEQLELEER